MEWRLIFRGLAILAGVGFSLYVVFPVLMMGLYVVVICLTGGWSAK